jgi:tetratricopeptide (TPR) repeat protein
VQWAMAQNNLGAAFLSLGKRESGTARLEDAVAAYRAALTEWTRERVPVQWAMAQNNLGAAFLNLGVRESGTARLEEAVTAYSAALTERTRERVPLYWAGSIGDQAVALLLLAERLRDARMGQMGVSQIILALETVRDAGHEPLVAYFTAQLARADALLARLSKR